AQRLDAPIPPAVSGLDAFFEFLFAGQEVGYAELKEKAAQQEPLPRFALRNVKITFNLDADYKVVRTQLTRNVVGIVPGRDPALRDTYVAFGAHYDHVGYSEGEVVDTPNGPRPAEADTVYLVGSDRISTELHNTVIDSNDALPKPLRLDFEMNDPTDLEGIYYRSDHYSYAAKGIPIVFLTTGLHPDYHANTDSP